MIKKALISGLFASVCIVHVPSLTAQEAKVEIQKSTTLKVLEGALSFPLETCKYGYTRIANHKKKAALIAMASYIAYDITYNPESIYKDFFQASRDRLQEIFMNFFEKSDQGAALFADEATAPAEISEHFSLITQELARLFTSNISSQDQCPTEE